MIDHLVRRGLSHASSGVAILKRSSHDGPELEIPQWGIGLILAAVLGFAVFLSMVEYTLKDVIATLAMIETPTAAITVSTPQEPAHASKNEKEGLLETTPTITLVRNKPLTSSIRGSIRHLTAHGGCLARWRGYKIHLLWALAFTAVAHVLAGVVPRAMPFRFAIVSGIAGALCANLHAAWINKVVSMPSGMKFMQRIPSRKAWKVLAFPAAVSGAMPYFSLYMTRFVCQLLGFRGILNDNVREYSGAQWTWLIVRIFLAILIGLSCSLFLTLPAVVTQVRIEASLIPEDQDTIVPFDRTFDGKVVPKTLGGTGVISFLDAWRSFNWASRGRLLKLYLKIVMVIVGLMFVFAHVIIFFMFAIMGSQLSHVLSRAKHGSVMH